MKSGAEDERRSLTSSSGQPEHDPARDIHRLQVSALEESGYTQHNIPGNIDMFRSK